MSDKKMKVTATPHIRSSENIPDIMLDVIIALAPAAVIGAFYFGLKSAAVMLISIGSSVLFEFLYRVLLKKSRTVTDLSAAVTGLLLAFCLPPNVELWVPVIGSLFAIVIVKQLFGGLGQNFVNPALAARAFLLAAYPVYMTNFTGLDGVSGATPLGVLKEGLPVPVSLFDAFIGKSMLGTIGETCTAALLLGFIYLLLKRIVNWRVPVTYLLSFALFTWIIGRNGMFTGDPLIELCLGGVMLGAIFMATDYTTSPVTPAGQLIMGIGCGALNAAFRLMGGYPEGTTYAILFMNLTVPLIDKFTKPKVYGVVKRSKAHGNS